MKTRNLTTAAAVALALMSGGVLAQEVQHVEVQATRMVNAKVAGRSSTGVPIVDLSLSYGVSLAGLDLGTNSGAKEAERRVAEAANSACHELGRRYPGATPSDQECAKQATDKAMERVHELVVAAESTPPRG